MDKIKNARLIYSIFIGVFTVAVGIAIICVCADIYYSGKGTDVIYSSAIVSHKLKQFIAPLVILIVAMLAGAVFPLYEVKTKRRSEDTLKKLKAKMPESGDGADFENAKAKYNKFNIIRIAVWSVALAVALAGVIASLVYLANTANFKGEEITKEILNLVKNVLSWAIAGLVAIAIASVVNGILAGKQLTELKTMIKLGNKATKDQAQKQDGENDDASNVENNNAKDGINKCVNGVKDVLAKIKAVADSKITLWTVRGAVFIIAIVFIVLGAINGGAQDVLIKAINICQECIGLG